MKNFTKKKLWTLLRQLNNLKQASRSWVKHCEEGELYREEPVELAEIIEEQLESSSEDLGQIEADPDKETFDDKNEVSDREWDALDLTSSAPPTPAACMDKIKEESIHSEPGEDEVLETSDDSTNKEKSDASIKQKKNLEETWRKMITKLGWLKFGKVLLKHG